MNFFFSLIVIRLFLGCSGNVATNERKLGDTIVASNGFVIIFDAQNRLKSLSKDHASFTFDTVDVIFRHKDSSKSNIYFINTLNGLYKSKHYVKLDNRKDLKQNQIIYYDTTSLGLMLKPKSDLVFLKNLPDTIAKGETVKINLNIGDSIYPYFKFYRINSEAELSLNLKHIEIANKFFHKNGASDILVVNKSGDFYYKGFMENYFIDEQGNINALTYYYCKKIHVK